MLNWLKRMVSSGYQPSLDDLRFDWSRYVFDRETIPYQQRLWFTPNHDGITLNFFAIPPDLPTNTTSVNELEAFYRRLVGESGKLVEIQLVLIDELVAIRTLLSLPQQPSGRTALGALTLPFRDCSYVVKCQCVEQGPTGLKAALLFDRSRAANEPMSIENGRFHIPGFDPDDPKHDAEFPHDPIARARRWLGELTRSIFITEPLRSLPRFPLPACSLTPQP
jgi:hypothetical protein